MKKLLFLFAVLFCLNTKAQSYYKFLNNSTWYESENSFGMLSYFYYNQSTDTVIHNLTYAKILPGSATPFFVREDTIAKKVFILTVNDTAEVILYDFSLNVGDTLYAKHGWGAGNKLIVRSINTITTLAGPRKQFQLSDSSGNFSYQTIESIGCPLDPFLNDYAIGDPQSLLVCSYQNNQPLYNCNCGLPCFDNITMCFNSAYTISTSYNDNIIISNDFNNDGRADLVTNYYNGVSVFLADISGTFSSRTDYQLGSFGPGLTSADFNNDGNKDILSAQQDSLFVLLGNGTGGFGTITKSASGVYNPNLYNTLSNCLKTADFNNDGKQDAVITDFGNGGVYVALGNGNGTFGTPQNFAASSNDGLVISADFNNDNKADLAVLGSSISILLGNGSGGFAAPVHYLSSGGNLASLTSADFNNDGRIDLAVTNNSPNSYYNDSLYVLFGSGTGAFNTKAIFAKTNLLAITSADFNADGNIDIAAGCGNLFSYSTDTGLVIILAGNGAGNFIMSDTILAVSNGAPFSITAADFNNDYKIDLATTTYTTGTSANVIINCSANTLTNTSTGINNQTKVYNTLPTSIYPNPAQNNFTIEVSTNEKQQLQLFDISGKQVLSQTISGTTTIDISQLESGVYFIQVKNGIGVSTKKIVVQR